MLLLNLLSNKIAHLLNKALLRKLFCNCIYIIPIHFLCPRKLWPVKGFSSRWSNNKANTLNLTLLLLSFWKKISINQMRLMQTRSTKHKINKCIVLQNEIITIEQSCIPFSLQFWLYFSIAFSELSWRMCI